MFDVYNTVLQLARERRFDINAFSSDQPPAAMPSLAEMTAALENMYADRYSIPDVTTNPVLRCGLMRMGAINKMVFEHAAKFQNEPELLVGALISEWRRGGGEPSYGAESGEMTCPECHSGTLCYLLGSDGGAFIECSTVGCLYWDARQ